MGVHCAKKWHREKKTQFMTPFCKRKERGRKLPSLGERRIPLKKYYKPSVG